MFGTKLSVAEQCFIFKRLAFLIAAGVPLIEALRILGEQAANRSQAMLFSALLADVNEGQSLSRSLAKQSNTFSAFSLSIVKIGEQSGTLSSALTYLSDELRKRQELRRLLIGASIYPALITVATFGITAFLLLFLFPKITPIFTSMHVVLPLSTRMVMAASSFLTHDGVQFLGVLIAAGIAGTIVVRKSRRLRILCDRLLLRMPVIGEVIKTYNASHISRTLGLLLKSGIALSVAVGITAETTHNLLYRRELFGLARAIERGDKVSDYLERRAAYFLPTMRHLVAVGERSGSLSETLLYIAEGCDAEVSEFTKRLTTLVEPVLMIVMGLLVGFIAISIITPLYGITEGLHA